MDQETQTQQQHRTQTGGKGSQRPFATATTQPQDYDINIPVDNICCSSSGFGHGKLLGQALDCIVVTPSSYSDHEKASNSSEKESTPINTGIVTSESSSAIVASSDFLVQFPPQYSKSSIIEYKVLLQINGNLLKESFLSMNLPTNLKASPMCSFAEGNSTKPSTEKLEQLVNLSILSPGRNLIRYFLVKKKKRTGKDDATETSNTDKKKYTIVGQIEAYVFLWSVYDTIIISDIDGTVTKSDVRGVIDSIFTEKYGHVHDGVCSLFSELVKFQREHKDDQKQNHGKVRVLYLSSRPMTLIHSTRKFLSLLSQRSSEDPQASSSTNCGVLSFIDDNFISSDKEEARESGDIQKKDAVGLPSGPIFLHSGSLSTVLFTELVTKSTHEFKADLLARQVVLPFVAAGKEKVGALFLAGFGNKKTDSLAYEMVGMNTHQIYIIDSSSKLVSTSHALEFEDSFENESSSDCIDVILDPTKQSGELSSEKIVVSNPKKNTKTGSQKKRHFKGYTDPKLRTELFRRMHTQ